LFNDCRMAGPPLSRKPDRGDLRGVPHRRPQPFIPTLMMTSVHNRSSVMPRATGARVWQPLDRNISQVVRFQ